MRIILAGAAILLAAVVTAAAQSAYPARPVVVLVPFAAGGTADALGRIFAERLSARMGQQFLIENRTGAGGNTGVAATARAAPDGYTLGVASVTIAINPHVYREKMPFDPARDLKPLHLMATQPNLLVVHPSVPARTLSELIAYLKANPGRESFASSGVGTSLHLCMELLMAQTGVTLPHVAYRASNQVIQDVIAGHVKVACDNAASAVSQVKAGTVRGIGVSSLKRLEELPDLPALAETLPGFEALTWFGFVAPADLPAPIADRLVAELAAVAAEPAVQQRLRQLSAVPSTLAGPGFGAFIRSELEKWGPVVEKAGIKMP
ncbi:Bug family tripartite tricarboxylate transporter substrate binding protein [uncultured Enterovirga sp.]|uniref:Bug family tripartite tricarboxylate transporter substrate binding protein n=1 Tax=uncultured Enterovirga sp. TaxID=2026352 RepID=UPI0035C9921A